HKGPLTLHLACASKETGKLQYVGKALGCPTSRGKLVHFPGDAPVQACLLNKSQPGPLRRASVPAAHRHAVPGMLFRVDNANQCKPPKHRDTTSVVLPGKSDIKLCAGRRRGTIREVQAYSACNQFEFPDRKSTRLNSSHRT